MSGRPVVEVLSLPVRLKGIQLGRAVDALLHAHDDRVVGFEVLCGDGEHRFLPFAVARVEASEIAVDSSLPLIDAGDAEYYRQRTRKLRELGFRDPRLEDGGTIREG